MTEVVLNVVKDEDGKYNIIGLDETSFVDIKRSVEYTMRTRVKTRKENHVAGRPCDGGVKISTLRKPILVFP